MNFLEEQARQVEVQHSQTLEVISMYHKKDDGSESHMSEGTQRTRVIEESSNKRFKSASVAYEMPFK